jgi:hypothetical protein
VKGRRLVDERPVAVADDNSAVFGELKMLLKKTPISDGSITGAYVVGVRVCGKFALVSNRCPF